MTSRPPFTSSAAAPGRRAAVEAKAEEGQHRTAPLTRPAAGGSPTPCPASTSSAAERTGTEAKTEEERPSRAACAPKTPSAPDRAQTAGTEATPTVAVSAASPEVIPPASGEAHPRTRRFRVECLNPSCGWVGYRRNAYQCECYDYPCRPTAPGMGCPNGANLRASCPRCNSDWEPSRSDLFRSSYFRVRETWSRQTVGQILAGRAKLRKERERSCLS